MILNLSHTRTAIISILQQSQTYLFHRKSIVNQLNESRNYHTPFGRFFEAMAMPIGKLSGKISCVSDRVESVVVVYWYRDNSTEIP